MTWREALIHEGMKAEDVDRFLAYHTLNPAIWKLFEKAALEFAQQQGVTQSRRKKIGGKEIAEAVRKVIGIDNRFISAYTRALVIKHSWLRSHFILKSLSGLKEALQTGLELRSKDAA